VSQKRIVAIKNAPDSLDWTRSEIDGIYESKYRDCPLEKEAK